MITAVDAPEPQEPEKPLTWDEQLAKYRKDNKQALQNVADTVAAKLGRQKALKDVADILMAKVCADILAGKMAS